MKPLRQSCPDPSVAASAGQGPTDASTLLSRVGRELDGLALTVIDLQSALGPAFALAAASDPAVMAQVQRLDLVAQSLETLSSFLALAKRRSVGLEPLAFDELTAALPLRALADRLGGRATDDAGGEVELF